MSDPAVSVIVPVYNVEQYLQKSIDGMIKQTYPDFELLLVDDGSGDGSGAVCDRFAEQDSRIRVIHKENGGVSSARNRGLDEARGEFVVFVDADDLVRPDYLLDLLNAQRKLGEGCGRTMIVADYQPFNDSGAEERSFPKPFSMDFNTGEGLTAANFRELIFKFRLFPPYCKLYRRDVIEMNGIRFREGMKSAEDFEFNTRYLAGVDRLEYIASVQYDYRIGYKKYVPSNHGVLGSSEIKSAHIMAHGISDLAERMGIMGEVGRESDLWVANKHYFNRLRMLFMKSDSVNTSERRKLYRELISDPVYHGAARRGACMMKKSLTRFIAQHADRFWVWSMFYHMHRDRADN